MVHRDVQAMPRKTRRSQWRSEVTEEWLRLTNNLYVAARALGRARDEVDRLEGEYEKALNEVEHFERRASSASVSQETK